MIFFEKKGLGIRVGRISRRFLHFCCREAGKTSSGFEFGLAPSFLRRDRQKLRIRSKGSPWSAGCGSWSCDLSGRINEVPEWCFGRWLQFSQNLEELAHGVRPGHADILVSEHEEIAILRPGLCLPRSAQVQLVQCLFIGQMVALGLDDDYLPGARSRDKIRIVIDEAIEGETRSREITMQPPDICIASKLIELQDTRFLELFKPKVTMDPTPWRGGVGRGGGEPLPYCSCRDNSMDISLVYCATFFCIIQGLRLSGDVMNLSFPLLPSSFLILAMK